jgi:hypothetical protein
MNRSVPLAKAMDDAIIASYRNGERVRPGNGYAIQPRDFHYPARGQRVASALAQAIVRQTGLSVCLKPARPDAEGSLAHAQNFGGFKLAQVPFFTTGQSLSKFQHPPALQLLSPAHPTLRRAELTGHFTRYVQLRKLRTKDLTICHTIHLAYPVNADTP